MRLIIDSLTGDDGDDDDDVSAFADSEPRRRRDVDSTRLDPLHD